MLELILGQIPEAIYFSLFMMLIKDIKDKRMMFMTSIISLYLILANIFPYNLKFSVLFVFGSYIIMRMLYHKIICIADLFLYCFAYMLLILSSLLCFYLFVICLNLNMVIGAVSSKILLIIFIILFKNRLQLIYKRYKINWNKKIGKILSLSIRNSSLLLLYAIILIVYIRLNI